MANIAFSYNRPLRLEGCPRSQCRYWLGSQVVLERKEYEGRISKTEAGIAY
jgi:hypothetical protein